ncbi:unnamed protein product [Phytomonas sp. EM1]|nr:unnamed protein product [Phytomonas sp. EM1]|eukprot:CCW60790.1 unnamed protein product [Phytomonas sp. isolate EM1]
MPDMRQAMSFSRGAILFLTIISLLFCFDSVESSTPSRSLTDRLTRIQAPVESLRWAILLDLTRTALISEAISSAVEKYSSEIANGSKDSLFARRPTILDSNGSSATALSKVYDLISDGSKLPDVLFLAETTEVSFLTLNILRSSEAAAKILVILIGASNEILCNPILNPRLVCIVPQDLTNFRGVMEVASTSLGWESVAVISDSSRYGINFQKIASTQLQGVSDAPTIVGEAFMNSASLEAEDDALLAKLILHKPKGIACFVDEKQLERLQKAIQRANLDVFLLGNYEALGALRQMNGTYQRYVKPYGALFVSTYETAERLVANGYFQQDSVDEYGAYIMSHLFDGMRMITEATGIGNMSALHAVRFVGFTGIVAFSPLRSERVETSFSIILDHYRMPNPLVTWESGNCTSKPIVKNYDPIITAALIPSSPLRSAVICLAVPPTCADSKLMSAMLFVLLLHNKEIYENAKIVPFLPVAFNTGLDGIAGLSTLSATGIGRACTVLVGPGHNAIAEALTPVLNSYQIPQLDYAITDDLLTSDNFVYPFFSRTAPPNTLNYFAYSGTCKYFGWERVIILSTADNIGSSRAKTMLSSMESQNIYVEKTFLLQNSSEASIVEALNVIYEKHISRIILVMLSLYDENAEMFFNLIDKLPFMNKYVFFLSSDLCLHGAAFPEQRNKLQSSICLSPYVPADRLKELDTKVKTNPVIFEDVKNILRNANLILQAKTCSIMDIPSFTGFAVDAAYVLIDAVERALAANISLKTRNHLLPLIRRTSINNFTEDCTINNRGDRNFAVYEVNIQIPDSVLGIGVWNTRNKQPFSRTYSSSFIWMTNSTSIPLDTFRDYSFILDNTMSASSGTILLCALGFLITFGLFFFCYQHYRVQTQIEMALLSNNVPITEEELRRLKGIQEDI